LEERVSRINTNASGVAPGSSKSDSSHAAKTGQRSKETGGKSGRDDDDDDLVGPPLPPGFKPMASSSSTSKTVDDDDDDMVGPPLPPGFKLPASSTAKKSQQLDEDIGPPLPPGFKPATSSQPTASDTRMKASSSRDGDEDDDEEEEEEEEVSNTSGSTSLFFKPALLYSAFKLWHPRIDNIQQVYLKRIDKGT
jgi:ribosomal protein L12E/L44/L45/RPP1/RPP2